MFQWQTVLFPIGLICSQLSSFKTFLKLKYQKIRQHLDRNIFDVVWKITLDTDKQIQTCFWKKSALADRETHSLRDKTRRWVSQDFQTTAMAGTRLTASTTTWRGSLVHSSYQSASLSASFCLLGQESMGRSWRRWGLTTRARRTTWTASSSVQTLSGMVGSSEHQQTNFREENIILKILCLRVSSEAGGDPPQAWHRPGDHHNHCQPQNPPSTDPRIEWWHRWTLTCLTLCSSPSTPPRCANVLNSIDGSVEGGGDWGGIPEEQGGTLPAEVKERFLWRAIIIMHSHPLVSCNRPMWSYWSSFVD